MRHYKVYFRYVIIANMMLFVALNTIQAQTCEISASALNNVSPLGNIYTITMTPNGDCANDPDVFYELSFTSESDWVTWTHFGNSSDITITVAYNPGDARIAQIDISYLNNYAGTITISQKINGYKWYPDQDSDGLGDYYAQPKYGFVGVFIGEPYTYFKNNQDLCPYVYGLAENSGCLPDEIPESWNTVTTKVFDINHSLEGANRSYFDALGKQVQTQRIDINTNRIWVGETFYDSQGRPGLQTLSAPSDLSVFGHKEDFTRNSGGSAYSSSDFESNIETPSTVGGQVNTLGWYYTDQNTDTFHPGNSYRDITSYPFVRPVYSTLNPGAALRILGGNKVDTDGDGDIDGSDSWPQAYTFSMRASEELSQSGAFGLTKYNNYKILKTVSRDVHGVENAVFTDTDGKILAASRSGGTTPRSMQLMIGEQGYVDIHVPAGSNMGFTVSAAGNTVTTYDLITEATVTASTSLPNGFYRVSVDNPDSYVANSASVTYQENYYDYALNEYDKVGRLTASYQPLNQLKTEYEYNTLGQLVYTKSPDEGEAWFKYRNDGQIRYSQNSKQLTASPQEVSYTEYDIYGRPNESGVIEHSSFSTLDPDAALPSGTKKEQQFTTYDEADNTALASLLGARATDYPSQDFVASNVARTENDQSTTYYSYDIYGRVKWLVQDIDGLTGAKTVDYEYDPVTGAVIRVIYQKDMSGEYFVHRYTYNVVDQLVKVETSLDGNSYTTNAEYEYYETGALKRTELADGIQGVDYVYNLAGQLKSLNHPSLSSTKDPGGDSNDLFGMQLDYHNADYQRTLGNINTTAYGTDQLNGNIKGIRWNNDILSTNSKEYTYIYSYDRNNWLSSADYGQYDENFDSNIILNISNSSTYGSATTTTLEAGQSITLTNGFHAQSGSTFVATIVTTDGFEDINSGDYDVEGISYDANGNIQTLQRNKNTVSNSNAMDNLTYTYDALKPNQLVRVDDSVGDVSGADDIGDQDGTNYVYNEIGQLITNNEEGISYLYNTSGLVTEVQKNNLPLVKFFYNDRNHRIKKEGYDSGGTLLKTEYYVRDVSGSVMAIYYNGVVVEQPIYGSGRLGVFFRTGSTGISVYQLTDHLGNVRATFAKTTGGSLDSRSGNDYYPFGMPMPGRNSVGDYRYAFQGQEKDSETGKEAFELRLWDSRIGRWLSPDPMGEFHSPYLGMGNNPISTIDPDGGCTTCPDNAKKGDTYNHADYDNSLTFDGANWLDSVGNLALDGVTGTQYTNGPLDQMGFSGVKIAPAITELSGFSHFMAELGENTLGRSTVPIGIGNIHYNIDGQGLATHIAPQGGSGGLGLLGGPVTASQKVIVIGEGMSAVKNTAKGLQARGINAKWYQAWSKNFPKNRPMTQAEISAAVARNKRWIHSKIKEGYKVYDIGIDASRARRSIFYQVERDAIQQFNYSVIKLPR